MNLTHVAFIPDGNRRWAKKQGKSLAEAYEIGIRKIKDVLEWCKEKEIKEATFWGFSTENFKRSEEEKRIIWSLFEKVLSEILREVKKRSEDEKQKFAIRFRGNLELLPKSLVEKMEELEAESGTDPDYRINMLLAYGGKAELVRAARLAAQQGEITEESITRNLFIPEDVDLIIRTGGQYRTSGYLIWQSSYSEYFFTNKLWPEFSKEDFFKAVDDYYHRERRFGR